MLNNLVLPPCLRHLNRQSFRQEGYFLLKRLVIVLLSLGADVTSRGQDISVLAYLF